jgi:uncharacterized membrane protein YhdT
VVSGTIFLLTGVVLMIIAFVDIFKSMSGGTPTLFYLFFIALPLIFIGLCLLIFGLLRRIFHFTVSQTIDTQKDFANYMIKGTKDSVVDLTKGINDSIKRDKKCPNCAEYNDENAKFCDKCGAKLDD